MSGASMLVSNYRCSPFTCYQRLGCFVKSILSIFPPIISTIIAIKMFCSCKCHLNEVTQASRNDSSRQTHSPLAPPWWAEELKAAELWHTTILMWAFDIKNNRYYLKYWSKYTWQEITLSSHIESPFPAQTSVGLNKRNSLSEHVPPSNRATAASMRNGAVFPANSYITLPNGGPTVEDTLGSGVEISCNHHTSHPNTG